MSLATSGGLVSTFDLPDPVNLGHCNLIEIIVGEDKVRTCVSLYARDGSCHVFGVLPR